MQYAYGEPHRQILSWKQSALKPKNFKNLLCLNKWFQIPCNTFSILSCLSQHLTNETEKCFINHAYIIKFVFTFIICYIYYRVFFCFSLLLNEEISIKKKIKKSLKKIFTVFLKNSKHFSWIIFLHLLIISLEFIHTTNKYTIHKFPFLSKEINRLFPRISQTEKGQEEIFPANLVIIYENTTEIDRKKEMIRRGTMANYHQVESMPPKFRVRSMKFIERRSVMIKVVVNRLLTGEFTRVRRLEIILQLRHPWQVLEGVTRSKQEDLGFDIEESLWMRFNLDCGFIGVNGIEFHGTSDYKTSFLKLANRFNITGFSETVGHHFFRRNESSILFLFLHFLQNFHHYVDVFVLDCGHEIECVVIFHSRVLLLEI
ncbi:hypothetical protein VP01_5023g1 [Puccinia sorghi]|uniref:Uncharacterized protein n=1 Tax=Puccinia sorghi TaxID=27349 RepID=A0A0L6ULM1_9BASI|nr:hypothetical protein VP01_5023g1 [Puccinia sorghi]